LLSSSASRFAAKGLRMIRSESWTVTSSSIPFQAWFVPKSTITSSRVLATLQTFA